MENKEIVKVVLPYLLLFILALIVLNYFKKGANKMANSLGFGVSEEQKKQANETVRESAKNLDKKKLKYRNDAYNNYANVLYGSMKGSGTDEATIKRIFSYMTNTDDVRALIVAFGIRDDMNLNQWVRAELEVQPFYWNDYTLKTLNESLKNKKIAITF